ncbi:MAG: hypothetical protein ACI83P_001696 [Janthinobacterium sp.]|jgi:uncharacterized protein (DUF2164 family)
MRRKRGARSPGSGLNLVLNPVLSLILRFDLRYVFKPGAAFAVCFKRCHSSIEANYDALQKNQFSGELPALKAVFAEYHVAIQHGATMAIKWHQDVPQRLLASIQRYRTQRMQEPAGTRLRDFSLLEIGPSIYNQAILDAQQGLQKKTPPSMRPVMPPNLATGRNSA